VSDKTVSVGLKIDGDAKGAQAAVDATDKALQKLPEASQKAKTSADRLNESFSKLGIRSAAQIEADILDVNQALADLARRSNVTGADFDRAFAAGQAQIAKLKTELHGLPDDMGRVEKKADSMLGLFGQLGLAFTGLELARQFVLVNAELENVERSFRAVAGSSTQAAAEMDFARDVANRLGREQVSTARAYASLMASVKGTSVEGNVSRQVFESVARSMSLAGKSAADTEGALLALQQMASKGVISMEELRGQLGERLPGALNAAAEGLGITTAQLIKLTETGQLTAEELFPALAAGLNKLYADAGAETLTQEWNHFRNAVQDAYETIGVAGAVNVLKGALEGLSAYLSIVSVGFVALGEKIGTFFGALASGDIGFKGFSDNARQAFDDIEKAAQDKLLKTAQHNDVLAAMMGKAGQVARESAGQQGEAATAAASDWTKLNVAFATVKEAGEAATKQAEKNAEAKKAEGEAALAVASALGAEADQHRAKVDAARQNAAALAEVAERRREELAVATEHIAALEREAAANGGATEQQQKVIDALKKTAEARQADAEKSAAQAAQSQTLAVQAQVEAAAYEQAHGALSRWSEAKQALFAVDQAGIRLAIEQQRTIYEVARARGDEYTAVQALMEIKRLEIKLAELTAQAKRAEAEAALLAVRAKREELQAAGQLTAAKEAELRAQEAGARVKQVESQIAGETAKRMRELAEATDFGAASAGRAAGHFGTLSNTLDGVRTSARQAAVAMSDLDRYDANKFSAPTSTGSFLDGGHQASRSVGSRDILYRSGATIDEAKLAEKYFGELFQRNAQASTSKIHSTEDNNRYIAQASRDAAEEAIRLARIELQTGQAADLGDSVADITQRALVQLSTRGGGFRNYRDVVADAGQTALNQPTKTIRIDIGSGANRTTLQADDDNAAAKLIRTLEQARIRTSR